MAGIGYPFEDPRMRAILGRCRGTSEGTVPAHKEDTNMRDPALRLIRPAALGLALTVVLSSVAVAQEEAVVEEFDFEAVDTLVEGVPLLEETPGASVEFVAEDAIHEDGRHYFFIADTPPVDLIEAYGAALTDAGWEITSGGGDQNPFAGGAGLTATDGTRYLKIGAGGPAFATFVDGCIWPQQPIDDDCQQQSSQEDDNADLDAAGITGATVLGARAGLLSGVPKVPNVQFVRRNRIRNGGQKFYFRSSVQPVRVVNAYKNRLQENGWRIVQAGGQNTRWGGNAGLTATKGGRYLKFGGGGSPFTHRVTTIDRSDIDRVAIPGGSLSA